MGIFLGIHERESRNSQVKLQDVLAELLGLKKIFPLIPHHSQGKLEVISECQIDQSVVGLILSRLKQIPIHQVSWETMQAYGLPTDQEVAGSGLVLLCEDGVHTLLPMAES